MASDLFHIFVLYKCVYMYASMSSAVYQSAVPTGKHAMIPQYKQSCGCSVITYMPVTSLLHYYWFYQRLVYNINNILAILLLHHTTYK